jgi:Camelysin metallo-endopeptidase
MKRKIRLSALIAVMVLMLALLIGGLYGTFDDTESGNPSVFTAGTLDLMTWVEGTNPTGANMLVTASDNVNGIVGHVDFTNVAPGDNGTIVWTLTNDGTVNGNLTFDNVTVGFAENGTNEPEGKVSGNNNGGNGDLDEYMYYRLSRNGAPITGLVPFSGLEATLESQNVALGAGLHTTYELYWEIASTVGNVIQSDQATIDITFNLTQA